MNRIQSYCNIHEQECLVDGERVLHFDHHSVDSWPLQIYRFLGISYPKFHKMDQLSQFGFLAATFLARQCDQYKHFSEEEVAMVFANSSSCAVTDQRFLESYEVLSSPSPSIFVYTLPNIVMGEIAIHNKWYGENMFAILPKFRPDFFINHSKILQYNGSKAMLGCWLEVSEVRIDVMAFMSDFESEIGVELNEANLDRLYHKDNF
tara:strand:- start:595 stop:1212 length:618 start_codon:yes stop_codon:yes gene_type:complete